MDYVKGKSLSKRALETIAVSIFVFLFTSSGIFFSIMLVSLLFTKYWIITVLYAIWMFIDRQNETTIGRKSKYMRNLKLWKLVRDYFPIKLIIPHANRSDANIPDANISNANISDAILSKDENYIMINHPHGIMCFGTFISIGSNANNFDKLFPNMDAYQMALNTIFRLPIWRDIILSAGGRSVDRETFDNILGAREKGKLITVVVGGAREALDACPGKMDLTLLNRKGVFKIAMKHGAHIIPCISFGENEVYEQKYRDEEDSVKIVQKNLMKKFSFSLPYFHGRFFYSLIPYRKPITVVGKWITICRYYIGRY